MNQDNRGEECDWFLNKFTHQHTEHAKETKELVAEILRCAYGIGIRHPGPEVVDSEDIKAIALTRGIQLN